MTVVLQVSDPHFGTECADIVAALRELAHQAYRTCYCCRETLHSVRRIGNSSQPVPLSIRWIYLTWHEC